MKKYVKPELTFESFEVSQQIAACDFDSNNTLSSVTDCVFTGVNEVTGTVVNIFQTTSTCEVIAESYCEHASAGGMFNIFNS